MIHKVTTYFNKKAINDSFLVDRHQLRQGEPQNAAINLQEVQLGQSCHHYHEHPAEVEELKMKMGRQFKL